RRDRQRPGAAADVEHRLAGLDAREPHQLLAKGTLPAEQQEPGQKVVAGGRVEDPALRARCRVAIPRLSHFALRVLVGGHGRAPIIRFEQQELKNRTTGMSDNGQARRSVRPGRAGGTMSAHEKRTKDRRIEKTEALLRGALGALVREKPYEDIVV